MNLATNRVMRWVILNAVCERPAHCAMELACRLEMGLCMADCWIQLESLRRDGFLYLTSRGNYAATPKGHAQFRSK